MLKQIAICLAAVGAFAVPAAHLMADVIPPLGLAPGSQYQLIFVTADTRDATSSNIGDYNAFVTAEATLNPSLPTATWDAVASTGTVNANVNAPSGGLPVYNTQGILVASAATGLYTSNLLSPILYDQYGQNHSPQIVWTGSISSGASEGIAYLGLNGTFPA